MRSHLILLVVLLLLVMSLGATIPLAFDGSANTDAAIQTAITVDDDDHDDDDDDDK
jgi:hypothetical protein